MNASFVIFKITITARDKPMNRPLFQIIFAFSISCSQTSNSIEDKSPAYFGESPNVKSISYTNNQGYQTLNFVDEYLYEENFIKIRTETNMDTGHVLTYNYTYTDDAITSVQSLRDDDQLEYEVNINYDGSQRVASYNEVHYSDGNPTTYWQAVFLYDTDTLLHCDGQTWSSVEYKDVYESVYLYEINDNGDFIRMTRLEDCSFTSRPTTSGYEISVDYDDNPSPFSNVRGNNFVINNIIGIFTNSKVNGLYNNITKRTTQHDATEEVQTWEIDYNEFNYPQSMTWKRGETIQENIEISYFQMMD